MISKKRNSKTNAKRAKKRNKADICVFLKDKG